MIEGVLPECYFTNNLRGLSVDMAVFRDLLKLKVPKLSQHLDQLQSDAYEGASGNLISPFAPKKMTIMFRLLHFNDVNVC